MTGPATPQPTDPPPGPAAGGSAGSVAGSTGGASAGSTIRVYLPDSVPGPEPATLAASPASLAGLRIAVLDNGKPNAATVMTRAAQTLATRTGAHVALVTKKGPQGLSANAAIPVAPDVFQQIIDEADIVITGTADCGSCTAYSVHDAIELEKAGRPTVVVTTTRFAPIATTLSTSLGLPHTRHLVLPHPIGGTNQTTLHHWADTATEHLITLLTTSPTGPMPTPAAHAAPNTTAAPPPRDGPSTSGAPGVPAPPGAPTPSEGPAASDAPGVPAPPGGPTPVEGPLASGAPGVTPPAEGRAAPGPAGEPA